MLDNGFDKTHLIIKMQSQMVCVFSTEAETFSLKYIKLLLPFYKGVLRIFVVYIFGIIAVNRPVTQATNIDHNIHALDF